MSRLHELLWYLRQATALPVPVALHDGILAACAETERLTGLPADGLTALDLDAHGRRVVTPAVGHRVTGVGIAGTR